jgi:hypothetical protein
MSAAVRLADVAHLARRFAGSLSPRPPSQPDEVWAESHLLAHERDLWRTLSNPDRRHAIEVARRFASRRPDASRPEMAGALLHDVGKVASGLGTFGRVVATVVGPRTDRFRTYHDHERLGADALEAGGSDEATVALVRRAGPAAPALHEADHI